jgi:hypothetical protein
MEAGDYLSLIRRFLSGGARPEQFAREYVEFHGGFPGQLPPTPEEEEEFNRQEELYDIGERLFGEVITAWDADDWQSLTGLAEAAKRELLEFIQRHER